jgi:hypothetical protein
MVAEARRTHSELRDDPVFMVAQEEQRAAYEAEQAEKNGRVIEAYRAALPEEERQAKRARCADARKRRRRSGAWEQRREYTWEYKAYAQEFISDRVLMKLPFAEAAVLWFVFQRTVWHLSKTNQIDYRTMEHGINYTDDNGNPQGYDGLGLSKRQLVRLTQSLVDKGLLIRSREYEWQKYTYEIPRVDLIPDLPFFEGKNMAFTAPFGKEGKVTIGA